MSKNQSKSFKQITSQNLSKLEIGYIDQFSTKKK